MVLNYLSSKEKQLFTIEKRYRPVQRCRRLRPQVSDTGGTQISFPHLTFTSPLFSPLPSSATITITIDTAYIPLPLPVSVSFSIPPRTLPMRWLRHLRSYRRFRINHSHGNRRCLVIPTTSPRCAAPAGRLHPVLRDRCSPCRRPRPVGRCVWVKRRRLLVMVVVVVSIWVR